MDGLITLFKPIQPISACLQQRQENVCTSTNEDDFALIQLFWGHIKKVYSLIIFAMNRVTSNIANNIYWESNQNLDGRSNSVSKKFIWIEWQCGKSWIDLVSINICTRESISGRCYFIRAHWKKNLFCLIFQENFSAFNWSGGDNLRITPKNTYQPPAAKDNFDFDSTRPRFVAHFGAYCVSN